MLKKNDTVEVTIDSYNAEGLGVARVDGQVVFVHRGIRGETCKVLIMKVLKTVAYGKVMTVEEPSNHRLEPECPYFGKCGGCDYWHMDYEEELFAKKQRVQDAITRLGGSSVQVSEILGAKDIYRYRNKVQYPVASDGNVGFYHARSHDVIPIEDCLIQKETATQIRAAVQEYIRSFRVSCYDEEKGKGLLRHVFIRTNAKDESLLCLIVNGEKLPNEKALVDMVRKNCPGITGIVLGVNTHRGNGILGDAYRTLWGEERLTDALCGHDFSLSVPSFYQVNRDQAEVLYQKAMEYADLTGKELVLDLYCGVGTIGSTMAPKAKKVIGVEVVPEAIEDAKDNARANGLSNIEFYCGDAKDIALKLQEEGVRPDVICVDPPRKGMDANVITSIAEMNPNRVVYVSCDPATLGRDIKIFKQKGYVLKAATAVDLFPKTSHVETVVLLSDKKVDGHINIDLNVDRKQQIII